jgi:hypothetical protein
MSLPFVVFILRNKSFRRKVFARSRNATATNQQLTRSQLRNGPFQETLIDTLEINYLSKKKNQNILHTVMQAITQYYGSKNDVLRRGSSLMRTTFFQKQGTLEMDTTEELITRKLEVLDAKLTFFHETQFESLTKDLRSRLLSSVDIRDNFVGILNMKNRGKKTNIYDFSFETADKRLIIKSIGQAKFKLLNEKFETYYEYVKVQKGSLLQKIFGMFTIEM